MRWRISAAVIDNIIVYAIYLLVCLVLRWRVADAKHLVAVLVLGVGYHFVLEAHGGQTIGKRQYGLRVVTVDHRRAGPRAIALRSILRIVDSLPLSYLSGLISLVRTGPQRRQRIGDVAAGTTVVAHEGLSAARGTPNWMLPTATLTALALSVFGIYAVVQARERPLNDTQTAEFVAGCARSPGGTVVDCRCLLDRLEADGYVSIDAIGEVMQQARAEALAGRSGTARRELTAVGLACRH